MRGRLDRVRPYGATAIYDALMMALPLFTVRAHDRAAVVLISDGSDTASDVTREDVRWQIRLSDAFVYAVGIDAPERRPINDRVNTRLLRDITAESGGYAEVISDSPDLAPATERIAEELNHQYTLAYAPTRLPDGTISPHSGPGAGRGAPGAGAAGIRGVVAPVTRGAARLVYRDRQWPFSRRAVCAGATVVETPRSPPSTASA